MVRCVSLVPQIPDHSLGLEITTTSRGLPFQETWPTVQQLFVKICNGLILIPETEGAIEGAAQPTFSVTTVC